MVYCCVLKIGKWTKAHTIYTGKTIPAQEGTAKASVNNNAIKICL